MTNKPCNIFMLFYRIKTIICFICLLLLFYICGCHKTEVQPQITTNSNTNTDTFPYYRFTKDILDWGYFKKGSYWIYRNDTTGILDSLVIDSTQFYVKKGHSSYHGIYYYDDFYRLYYKNNKFAINEDYCGTINKECDGIAKVNDLYRLTAENFFCKLFWSCYNSVGTIDSSRLVVNNYPIHNVGSYAFSNVFCVKLTNGNKSRIVFYYLVKNIGTVKMEIIDSTGFSSYSLVKWNALQ